MSTHTPTFVSLVTRCVLRGSSVEDLTTVAHDGYTDMARYFFEAGGADRLRGCEPEEALSSAAGASLRGPPGASPAAMGHHGP
jgi:hypothetical protein